MNENEDMILTREQHFNNVSEIIFKRISDAENLIPIPTEAALLFHEQNFTQKEWNIYSAMGYSSTLPLFYFALQDVAFKNCPCTLQDIVRFMRKIIDKMQMATECIVISLIYLEKLMLKSKIEIRFLNWKPLVFTAILLASKFWDDISFWNIDYVETLELWSLRAINRMESEFLSLCDYNIYVSAEAYIDYCT